VIARAVANRVRWPIRREQYQLLGGLLRLLCLLILNVAMDEDMLLFLLIADSCPNSHGLRAITSATEKESTEVVGSTTK